LIKIRDATNPKLLDFKFEFEFEFEFGFRFVCFGSKLDLGFGFWVSGLVSNLPNPVDKVSTRTMHLLGMLHSQKAFSGFGARSFGFGLRFGPGS
jgi:hypothetical protein